MVLGVPGHHVETALGGGLLALVAAEHLGATHHGVDVRVLESGDEQAALQVDDLRTGTGQRAHRTHVGDGDDPAARDGDGGVHRGWPRSGEDPAPDEDGVGPFAAVRHRFNLQQGGMNPPDVFVEEE